MKNKGIVYRVVRSFAAGPDQDDMVQAGFIGLMRAVELFHPAKGAFISYAKMHVLYEIQQAARAKRGHRRGEQSQAIDAEVLFGHFLGAAYEGVAGDPSAHRANGSDGAFKTLACNGETEQVDARQTLGQALESLSDREAGALLAHLDGASTGEIAGLLGCKRDSVEPILARALTTVREAVEDLSYGD